VIEIRYTASERKGMEPGNERMREIGNDDLRKAVRSMISAKLRPVNILKRGSTYT